MGAACLRVAQCERREALLHQEPPRHTKAREGAALVREAVCWRGRRGAPWCCLPASDGAENRVDNRCARADDLGVWTRLCAPVAAEPDVHRVRLAAPGVRAHQQKRPGRGARVRTVARWRQHDAAGAGRGAR